MRDDAGRIVYLAGPMSGLPDYNFPEFDRVTALLRARGVIVVSPAETAGGVQSLGRAWYFRYDFAVIRECDAVYMMPNWTASAGAQAEAILATEMGIPVYQLDRKGEVIARITGLAWRVDFLYAHEEG